MSKENKTVVQFPIFGILGLIFITLKLTDYIDWSWWWVLAPFWAPLALALILIIPFTFLMVGNYSAHKRRMKRLRNKK